jgi:FhuF 2Fe-2S C-terminal domain
VQAVVPPADRGRVPPAVAPSYLFGWYVWAVACAAAVTWVAARRVPRLHPASVALHLTGSGWPDAVAVLAPGFACLPDDPEAGHRDARPAADGPALRAALLAEVDAHVEAFTAAWGRRGGRGPHSLRALATDALVAAVLTATPGARGLVEAEALLPGGPVPPRLRISCCLAYAVPGAQTCATCPRLTRA